MEIIIYKPSNMASPLISTSRLPSKSDNGTKPYRPSSSRGIHLPPISSQTSSNESTPRPEPAAAERLNELLPPMQERLHSAMGQLNNEVTAVESKLRDLLSSTWQDIYQMVALQASEHEKEVREVNFGLEQTRQELAEVTRRENALVRQQTSMSVEMVAEGKARRAAEEEAKSLKQKILSLEDRLQVAVSGADSMQQDHDKSLAALKQRGEELERKHRELQDKLAKANERSKKAGEELEAERNASEKLKRELADVVAQKGAETRKTAVEVSRLKSQLSVANQSLSESRGEVDKLVTQLKNQKECEDAAMSTAKKKHASEMRAMQQKIESLEKDIQQLHEQYAARIAALQQEIAKLKAAKGKDEDGIDARIQFLVHQNRREKQKIEKQLKDRSKVEA